MVEVGSETRFLHVIEMGLGAWQWGDRLIWQFGQGYSDQEVRDAFRLSVDEGILFIDTAEVYGNGMSERLLGKFVKETEQPILIATKYFPFPWRFLRTSIPGALKHSI
ncbi:MAG TPA: aldo/keto reductase, partial [Anaerolineales bacterium]